MKLNNISLPYPVLGISNDIEPLLSNDCVSVKLSEPDKLTYSFAIDLKFDNGDIEKLIKEGVAIYTCEYECAKTLLRKCIRSEMPHFDLNIHKNHVNGRINFCCYVTVVKPISAYRNKGFNEDYADNTFDMEEGDILIAFPPFKYDADINYEKLQSAGSFMQIREKPDSKDNLIFYDIEGDKIIIEMPTAHYETYGNTTVKGEKEIMHSSLVMNALTYGLMNISSNDENDTRMWVRAIFYRLETEDGYDKNDLDDPSKIPALAQKLLKDPYMRMFNKISLGSNLSEEE